VDLPPQSSHQAPLIPQANQDAMEEINVQQASDDEATIIKARERKHCKKKISHETTSWTRELQ
jgi:hypothetical protein